MISEPYGILLTLHFRVIESISHIIWILLLKKKIKKLMKCLKKIIYKQGFIQTVLLMSIFEKKIEFLNVIFCEKRSQNYPTIKEGVCRHCKLRIGFMAEPYWEFRVIFCLYSKQYCKLKANLFLYASKYHLMKIEFQNSIRRLSFLCRLTDIKIAWLNP